MLPSAPKSAPHAWTPRPRYKMRDGQQAFVTFRKPPTTSILARWLQCTANSKLRRPSPNLKLVHNSSARSRDKSKPTLLWIIQFSSYVHGAKWARLVALRQKIACFKSCKAMTESQRKNKYGWYAAVCHSIVFSMFLLMFPCFSPFVDLVVKERRMSNDNDD